jgi:predicted N-acyltransferase
MSAQQQQLNIELPEAIAEGIYANLVIIAHSQSEFVFDFARITPGIAKSKVQSRIIMTPVNAHRLLKTLEDNLKKYEEKFGKIDTVTIEKGKEIGFSME